jgi:uncharacterized protein YigE (DUF2233 family)
MDYAKELRNVGELIESGKHKQAINTAGSAIEAHLIRDAIRQYLDAQADGVGSRRHFQRSFQARIDRSA